MGEEITRTEFTDDDVRAHAEAVENDLTTLRTMIEGHTFDEAHPRAGMELEINLVDAEGQPKLDNATVLQAINDPLFVTELGQFNIELNLPPRQLGPHGLAAFEQALRSSLSDADQRAGRAGARLATVGILPTLTRTQLTTDSLTESSRFHALDERMRELRGGEPVSIQIEGAESLDWTVDSIAPEAACTSHQIHLQLSPRDFPAVWNAAQAIAGVQIALAANSPFFLGRQLWAETRVALFDQATDLSGGPVVDETRPRVWFGERWIDSIIDLFEENSRFFTPILPETVDDAADDEVPRLKALSLLNGTVYRWNRPVYDVSGGVPHVRLENRLLPAGPTPADIVADTAFFAGLVRALATQEHPVWRDEEFSTAHDNLVAGARDGIGASVDWPGRGRVAVRELVLSELLPLAAAGLEMWGVDGGEISRTLGVIEGRCTTGINGAAWQINEVRRLEGEGLDREEALRQMTLAYLTKSRTNAPVHTW